MIDWQNWSGAHAYQAHSVVQPQSESDLATVVQECLERKGTLRCVGSAHSFNPFWTDDTIIGLDAFSGVICVDQSLKQATVGAGTKIHDLGLPLWSQGLSLTQQGDIDRQSIAGAISTGTHGTGAGLHNISNSVVGLKLMRADGRVVELEQASEALPFAQVSLGLLGVILEVTLQVDEAFYLHEKTWRDSFEACQSQLNELIAENRHFEFFWVPSEDRFDMKTLNKAKDVAQVISDNEYIAPAYEAFPSNREVKFNEMEYSVPAEQGWACFMDLRKMFKSDFPKLPWPIEYRTLGADELPLSTASRRPTVTLSVHQGAERDPRPLFEACEAIFRKYDGRPHWGKMHYQSVDELDGLYPNFGEFLKLRQKYDPDRVFVNDYFEGMLGL